MTDMFVFGHVTDRWFLELNQVKRYIITCMEMKCIFHKSMQLIRNLLILRKRQSVIIKKYIFLLSHSFVYFTK